MNAQDANDMWNKRRRRLQSYIDKDFNYSQIAVIFECDRKTIRRHIARLGIVKKEEPLQEPVKTRWIESFFKYRKHAPILFSKDDVRFAEMTLNHTRKNGTSKSQINVYSKAK